MEYEYETAKKMTEDMARWQVQGSVGFGDGVWVRSTTLPPTIESVDKVRRPLIAKDDLPWPPRIITKWVTNHTVATDALRSELIQWADRLA